MPENITLDGIEYFLTPIKSEPEIKKPKNNVLYAIERPSVGQSYYAINIFGKVYGCLWDNSRFCEARFTINNVFLTEENAQKQADRNQLLADIQRFADENNDEIDWHDECKTKYGLIYKYLTAEWSYEYSYTHKILGVIYFSDSTIAYQALEKFKDRLNILLD